MRTLPELYELLEKMKQRRRELERQVLPDEKLPCYEWSPKCYTCEKKDQCRRM